MQGEVQGAQHAARQRPTAGGAFPAAARHNSKEAAARLARGCGFADE